MWEAWQDITRPEGEMPTLVCCPEHSESHPETSPLVLLLMDAGGMRGELCDMARRLAAAGYYVMLPNLYYRQGQEFERQERSRETMFAAMDALTNALVCDDIQALMLHAQADARASTAQVGCVGYCMSGPFAFAAAAAFPRQIAAAASFHGVRLFHAGPDSPHRAANAISAELYFGCAEQDEWAPPSLVNGLDRYLQSTSLSYRLEWYPGTQHGFVFPERDGIYQAEGAERHWARLLDLFGRNLGC